MNETSHLNFTKKKGNSNSRKDDIQQKF